MTKKHKTMSKYNIHHGKYYYDLQNTLMRMKRECFICGATGELQPHHIRQVKTSNSQYSDESNVVWLCQTHHKRYHHQYRKVNQKTFAEYCIRQKQKEINQLKKELKEYERILNKSI